MATISTASNPVAYSAGVGEAVLLIDADESAARRTAEILNQAGYSVERCSVDELSGALANGSFDLVLFDLALCGEPIEQFVDRLSEQDARAKLVAVVDADKTELALQSLKVGVSDFVLKPYQPAELLIALKKAQERERLKSENEMLKNQVARRYSFSNIIARSPAMTEIFETVRKISDYRTTVLLYGESGTGKELIARAIHHNSSRRNRRFVAINCGAIPENLLESELFGHKRGAFTDATRDKKGLFEEAEGGTILLDEIGELPLHLQVKLLRVLQENEIRPVGDSRSIPINVRIVAATLRDLENDVFEGRFRDDLFYRLNVINLKIPPLRERKEDIPLLINYFIKKNQEKLGLNVYGITKEAIAALMDHEWPGNIRELENCIERAMILTDGEEITFASLPRTVRASVSTTPKVEVSADELSIKVHTRILEESLIRKALEQTKGNRTHAARLLEISHRTLLYKLKEYNLAETADEKEAPAE